MTPEDIQSYFTQSDGNYNFARWGRPIAPVVFGVLDETVAVIKGGYEAICALSGHKMAETDPELGSNMMLFFMRDWDELRDTPNLEKMIPELPSLVDRLIAADATQYRMFRFDENGGIRAAFSFVRMNAAMSNMAAEDLALSQAVYTHLLWSNNAFENASPFAKDAQSAASILKPEIAGLIRAAYDPVMPMATTDASHALRLFARVNAANL